jgi:hypothetical protein
MCQPGEFMCRSVALDIRITITILKHKITHYFIQKTIAFFALVLIAAKRLGLH